MLISYYIVKFNEKLPKMAMAMTIRAIASGARWWSLKVVNYKATK